jgi:osmotically-inducible protein OsmY
MKHTKTFAILFMLCFLQGCAAVTVVAITAGASMVTDRRSIGNQIDDQSIEVEAYNEITKNTSLKDKTNLHVISVNGSVLIIGQAPTAHLRDDFLQMFIADLTTVNSLHDDVLRLLARHGAFNLLLLALTCRGRRPK